MAASTTANIREEDEMDKILHLTKVSQDQSNELILDQIIMLSGTGQEVCDALFTLRKKIFAIEVTVATLQDRVAHQAIAMIASLSVLHLLISQLESAAISANIRILGTADSQVQAGQASAFMQKFLHTLFTIPEEFQLFIEKVYYAIPCKGLSAQASTQV